MSYNSHQQGTPQGTPNQQQQLQHYAPSSQPQSPQPASFQHDQQSFSYSDGVNQVHQQQSSSSWSTSPPPSLPTWPQLLQLPQMQPMGMLMPTVHKLQPQMPYQVTSPPPQQQQYSPHPQQQYQQPLQLQAPQSPALPMSQPQATPYQHPAQQRTPHQIPLPQTPAAQLRTPGLVARTPAPVTRTPAPVGRTPAPVARAPQTPTASQVQALQQQQTQVLLLATQERQQERERAQTRERNGIEERLRRVEASNAHNRSEQAAKDREISKLREESAAKDRARLEDAEKHRQEMAELVRVQQQQQHQAQQAAQTPAFDMAALQQIISNLPLQQLSKKDIEAAVAKSIKEETQGFMTKADIQATNVGIHKALKAVPRGATEAVLQAVFARELQGTIEVMSNRIEGAMHLQQQRQIFADGQAQQQAMPWQQPQQVQAYGSIVGEVEEDDVDEWQQPQQPSQQPRESTASRLLSRVSSRQGRQRALPAPPTPGPTSASPPPGTPSPVPQTPSQYQQWAEQAPLPATPSVDPPQTPGQQQWARHAATPRTPSVMQPSPTQAQQWATPAPTPGTPGPVDQWAVASQPTGRTPAQAQQYVQPEQYQYASPPLAVAGPSTPSPQTPMFEGTGTALVKGMKSLMKSKKPKKASGQLQLEYPQTPAPLTSSNDGWQQGEASAAPMQDQYAGAAGISSQSQHYGGTPQPAQGGYFDHAPAQFQSNPGVATQPTPGQQGQQPAYGSQQPQQS